MYASHRVLGQFLAGSEGCPCTCCSWCDHFVDHVNTNSFNQLCLASCGIHQGHWCLAGRLCWFCLFRSHGVCSCQLCSQVKSPKSDMMLWCYWFVTDNLLHFHNKRNFSELNHWYKKLHSLNKILFRLFSFLFNILRIEGIIVMKLSKSVFCHLIRISIINPET